MQLISYKCVSQMMIEQVIALFLRQLSVCVCHLRTCCSAGHGFSSSGQGYVLGGAGVPGPDEIAWSACARSSRA